MTTKEWPTEMTDAARGKNKHLSNAEMLKDISETITEISMLRKCQDAYNVLANCHLEQHERRMYKVRESVSQSNIEERQAFVRFLQMLLLDRGVHVTVGMLSAGVAIDTAVEVLAN